MYDKVKQWFEARFNREFNPETDCYAQEWLDRFNTGHPENYMDGESLRIYEQLQRSGQKHE
jgi:hypothetical protein